MLNVKLIVGGLIVLGGCGTFYLVVVNNRTKDADLPPPMTPALTAPPQIHSAAWYVQHPEILKQDEQRCAGDAATLPQAACQNAASADAQLAGADYANAAAAFGSGTAHPTSNQKSP